MAQSGTRSPVSCTVLSKKQQKAAVFVSEDRKSDEEISTEVGIGRTTLVRWKKHEAFAIEVQRLRERYRDAALRRGIANLERRIDILNGDFDATEIIRQARAGNTRIPDAVGGRSGFIVRRSSIQATASGQAVTLEEFAFDAALMRERRELLKHAAHELGDWIEKGSMALELTPETARAFFAEASAKAAAADEPDEEPITG